MFDLIIKGGTLPDGQVSDIGIVGDKITAIGSIQTAEAGKVIDASGDLVSPPFVDPHFHMDATLSYGLPRINTSGTLLHRTRAYLLRLGSEHGAFGNSQPC